MLLKLFGAQDTSMTPLHLCCDIYQTSCECEACPPTNHFKNLQIIDEVSNNEPAVTLSNFGKNVLREKLKVLKEEYKDSLDGLNISIYTLSMR